MDTPGLMIEAHGVIVCVFLFQTHDGTIETYRRKGKRKQLTKQISYCMMDLEIACQQPVPVVKCRSISSPW